MLEDLFVKGELPQKRDPFKFISSIGKNKKDDKSSEASYDSFATSASYRVNGVKYSRLPNGMILNHDKDSLKK